MTPRGKIAVAFIAVLVVAGSWKLTSSKRAALREAEEATAAVDGAHQRAIDSALARARIALDVDPTEALVALASIANDERAPLADLRAIAEDAVSRGIARVLPGTTVVRGLALADSGALLVAGGIDRKVTVWKRGTEWKQVSSLAGHDRGVLDVVLVANDIISVDAGGTVRRWNIASGEGRELRHGGANYLRAKLSPDGARVVLFARFEAEVWKTDAVDKPQHTLTGCHVASWSPDGKYLVHDAGEGVERNGKIHLLDLATGKDAPVALSAGTHADAVTLATDGARVIAGQLDGRIDGALAGGSVVGGPLAAAIFKPPHRGPVSALVLLPTGTLSASSDFERDDKRELTAGDYSIVLSRGHQRTTLRGHRGPIDAIAISKAGDVIASAGRDGALRVWTLPPEPRRTQWTEADPRSHASITADRKTVVFGRSGPVLDVYDLVARRRTTLESSAPEAVSVDPATGKPARVEIGPDGTKSYRPVSVPKATITVFEVSRDGRAVVTLDDQSAVVYWDLAAAQGRTFTTGYVLVALSADGRRVLAVGLDLSVRLWEAASGTRKDFANAKPIHAVGFSPDGATVALAYKDGNLGLLDLATGNVRVLAGPPDRTRRVAFTHDGLRVLAGGDTGSLRVWDVASGTVKVEAAHGDTVTTLYAHRTQTVSGSSDGTVALWPGSGAPRMLRGHAGSITSVGFSDGVTVTTSEDRTARWWSSTGSQVIARHDSGVLTAAITDDGTTISIDRDGGLIERPAAVPREPTALRGWLAAHAR